MPPDRIRECFKFEQELKSVGKEGFVYLHFPHILLGYNCMIHHWSGNKPLNGRLGIGSIYIVTRLPWIVGANNTACSPLNSQRCSPGLIDELVRKLGKLGQILPDVGSTWVGFLAKGNG